MGIGFDVIFVVIVVVIVGLLILPAWFHELTKEEIREIAKDRSSE
jgi:hypothetical protein